MRSTLEWKFWGQHDPLWAVATWKDRQANGANPWTPEEFLEAGRVDARGICRHWDHFGRLSGGTCIEIGCGSGRMTSALLDYFDRVFAVDVSPHQIELAKKLLGEKLPRVEFRLVEDPVLDVESESCVAMFSTEVFQHLSEYEGVVAYLRESFRALVPGGSICFHIPVPGAAHGDIPPRWYRSASAIRTRLFRRLGYRRLMEYHRYQPSQVMESLNELGFVDLELRLFKLGSNNVVESFFFARKPLR
jgi:SAM-dependent methyltransferase